MLTALRLENFKSFKDERIELGPTTLLLGANASGKSNFLDALRFLQGVALGFSIEEVLGGKTAGGREIWPGIRGGAREVGFRGAKEFRITSEWEIGEEKIRYSISCGARSPTKSEEAAVAVVIAEQVVALGGPADEPLLTGQTIGDPSTARYRFHFGSELLAGGQLPVVRGCMGLNFAHWLSPEAPLGARLNRLLGGIQTELRALMILDPQPTQMRNYVPRSQSELGAAAEHLSAILAALAADPEERIALVDWLTELCGPEVADIDFSRTDLDDVMLVLVDAAGARTSARSLSDGTLRFLALLVALRDTIRNKILLLEEIESGLHPARLHLLVEQLEARAQAAGAQVIATTHSPTLLAALPDPTLRDAVVFAATPEHEGTLMRRLGDLPDFDEVVKRRGIEHLFTTRWLERAL